jgi:hypothetical protein
MAINFISNITMNITRRKFKIALQKFLLFNKNFIIKIIQFSFKFIFNFLN